MSAAENASTRRWLKKAPVRAEHVRCWKAQLTPTWGSHSRTARVCPSCHTGQDPYDIDSFSRNLTLNGLLQRTTHAMWVSENRNQGAGSGRGVRMGRLNPKCSARPATRE